MSTVRHGMTHVLIPMGIGSIPKKAKTPPVKGGGEDREVAIGTTYIGGARAVTTSRCNQCYKKFESVKWI
jgi:hypothetical protein